MITQACSDSMQHAIKEGGFYRHGYALEYGVSLVNWKLEYDEQNDMAEWNTSENFEMDTVLLSKAAHDNYASKSGFEERPISDRDFEPTPPDIIDKGDYSNTPMFEYMLGNLGTSSTKNLYYIYTRKLEIKEKRQLA